MSEVVLDSSAVFALLCSEPGGEEVAKHIGEAMISSVNLSEVYAKSADKGVSLESLKWSVDRLQLSVIPFDEEAAIVAGSLRETTRLAGLSLGDRACIGLGIHRKLPVLTTDKRWLEVSLPVKVIVIR